MPNGGLPTWDSTEPGRPAGPRLDAGLEVELLEWRGNWAQVACANGWRAWVDGTALLPGPRSAPTVPVIAGPPAGPPYPPAPPALGPAPLSPPAPASFPAALAPTAPEPLSSTALRVLTTPRKVAPGDTPLSLVGPYALVGAGLVIAGSLLPLFSVEGFKVSTWEVPAGFLFTDNVQPSGFKLGMLLMVAAVALLPALTRRPLAPLVLMLVAAPAANAAVGIFVRKLRADVYPDLGYGMAVLMAGGILMAAESLIPCWAAIKARAR